MMKLRDEQHYKYRKTNLDVHLREYKELKGLVNTSIFFEKKAFFDHKINQHQNNTKLLWKNLKNNIIPDFKRTGEIPQHLCDADEINKHFLNVPGQNSADPADLTYFNENRFCNSSFKFERVNECYVGKLILDIKSNAEGIDGITRDMFLLTLPHSLPAITAIINKSLSSSHFPSQWKIALVRPIPKNSNPTALKDLRPISILPYLSKILERVVYNQVTKYCELNNILPEFQSGFRKLRSTCTALIDVVDNLLSARDYGQPSILTLLDFSRAFDSINFSLLISKLNFYGFDCISSSWFNSYLQHRFQRVVLLKNDGNSALSSLVPVSRGVPQDSILGPLLFTIYSADITSCIKNCQYHLYADDLQIYIPVDRARIGECVRNMNDDLERISDWSRKNALVLNPTKSKYLVVGSKKQLSHLDEEDIRICVNSISIERVAVARNLGIDFDTQLRFEDYVTNLVKYSASFRGSRIPVQDSALPFHPDHM
ncbi:unnamed protein product [Colias eurytheme]|nr:unnamed protein product [Colias eurytheme]